MNPRQSFIEVKQHSLLSARTDVIAGQYPTVDHEEFLIYFRHLQRLFSRKCPPRQRETGCPSADQIAKDPTIEAFRQ